MKTKITAALVLVLLAASVGVSQKLELPKLEPTPATDSQKLLIREGVALHDQGDYDGAIKRYEQVLRDNPGNVQALYEMSFSYFARKDYQKSLEVGYKAAQYKSDFIADIYVQIGSCFDEMGNPAKAIEAYQLGLKLNPTSPLLEYNPGITYVRTGKLEEARAAAKRAATLDPDHHSNQLLLSSLFDKSGYRIPALLAACRFLILEPASNRSDTALRLVRKIMQAGVSPGKNANETNIFVQTGQKKDEGDFESVELFMGLMKAADLTEKNQDKSEMDC
jgi:tetratricopeptide (TPR) repeat protein